MKSVVVEAERGKLVLGICNGFQILCEARLLPGALIRNRSLRFVCEHVATRLENMETAFSHAEVTKSDGKLLTARTGLLLRMPIAHGEGNYTADEPVLRELERNQQVVLRYADSRGAITDEANPNGSAENIAGITNRAGNVFGMMPHPERACDPLLGSEDGKLIFPVSNRERRKSERLQKPMNREPAITPELIAKHGITPEEFGRICSILGREPNFTELGIFSVMWSEHCSYKNSKPELKKFPTTGPGVLVKAGEENAGVIDIGDGWAIAFKMESHNHPSAIEPFQGAATGVGGIIRDIFTMGARPVFSLNSLRFGPISEPEDPARKTAVLHNRRLFAGVVAGIAHYGNCIGIPTIGGEIYFDESYEGNPLVNVFCLGALRHEEIARGGAVGVGNPVFYVGAETGRDGLAGAAFASRDLTEESKVDRPAVQVGDPFREKLLLEACLELLASGAVAGIQDMGAAGLTCSTCETASRRGPGWRSTWRRCRNGSRG